VGAFGGGTEVTTCAGLDSVASVWKRFRCVISGGLGLRRPASAAEEDVLWTEEEEEEEEEAEVDEAVDGDDDAVFAGLIIFWGLHRLRQMGLQSWSLVASNCLDAVPGAMYNNVC
jgi:hypothetical protein